MAQTNSGGCEFCQGLFLVEDVTQGDYPAAFNGPDGYPESCFCALTDPPVSLPDQPGAVLSNPLPTPE